MSSGALGGADVTVIICAYTHDRWNDICDAIKSVVRQSLKPAECLVVVDHNRPLADELTAFVWRCDFQSMVTVIHSTGPRGLSGARNSGVARATTAIVAFLDDDAAADREWLAELVAAYDSDDVRGVGGHVRPRWPDRVRPGWFPSEFNWVVGCSYTGSPTEVAEVRNFIGANMSLRRDDVMAAEGFHTGLGRVGKTPLGCEETELCIRIRQRRPGARMMHVPAASVGHRVSADRVTIRYFLRRCHAEGISKAAVSGLVGSADGLQSERRYTMYVLPRGILGRLSRVVGTSAGVRQRVDLAAQTVVLAGGLLTTTFGYVRGRTTGAAIPDRLTPLHLRVVGDSYKVTDAASGGSK
ncbi:MULTISPECIES: glycosyltransferase family 2 protein [unclassified Gordonia (in: high G+C Gram-positive bacteria)]|uniref:glycosyltransferase family 2 protein n=1 Tax=unclassified Gordonia (in: high G+C Gram-positive bacteria) TaxID=2657482 RepID=UPI001F0D9E02|nr:glycosyltransferase family 2 protein [Gordonia sp. ABSL49_1]MCH5643941.1 glycosyltransferase [Gordonia sp. ABSL49_1]